MNKFFFYFLLLFSLLFYNHTPAQKSVSIDKLGAKGNGTDDDAKYFIEAFQNKKIDKILLGKNKKYLIKAKINITSDKALVGNNSSIIAAKNLDTLFSIKNIKNARLDNLKLLANSDSIQTGVFIINSDSVKINNVTFGKIQNKKNKGFSLGVFCRDNCNYLSVENSTFNAIKGENSGEGYAVHVANSSFVKIKNNKFYSKDSINSYRHAIYVSAGTNNSEITGNNIRNASSAGIFLNSYYYHNPVINNLVDNNVIYAGKGKYDFDGAIAVFQNSHHNIISNNKIFNARTYGILLSGDEQHGEIGNCSGNKIINNTVVKSGLMGIALFGAHDAEIISNIVTETNFKNKKDIYSFSIGVFDDLNYKGTSKNIIIKSNKVEKNNTKNNIFVSKSTVNVEMNQKDTN